MSLRAVSDDDDKESVQKVYKLAGDVNCPSYHDIWVAPRSRSRWPLWKGMSQSAQHCKLEKTSPLYDFKYFVLASSISFTPVSTMLEEWPVIWCGNGRYLLLFQGG